MSKDPLPPPPTASEALPDRLKVKRRNARVLYLSSRICGRGLRTQIRVEAADVEAILSRWPGMKDPREWASYARRAASLSFRKLAADARKDGHE